MAGGGPPPPPSPLARRARTAPPAPPTAAPCTARPANHRGDAAGTAADGAGARLQQAQSAYADTTLVAPIGGVIVKRSIEVGALAAPGTVAFAIADVDNVKAVFGVPDVFLSAIQLGATQKL